jgi:curved DNA-binding protein CbpA
MGNEVSMPDKKLVRRTTRRIKPQHYSYPQPQPQQQPYSQPRRQTRQQIQPQTQQLSTNLKPQDDNLGHLISMVSQLAPSQLNALKETNPYTIMGLEPTCSLQDLKTQYRKLSLRVHPDKGGNKFLFDLIANAYREIKLEKEAEDNTGEMEYKMSQPVRPTSYSGHISGITDREAIHISPGNFTETEQEKFNKVFEENKLETAFDRGYKLETESEGLNRKPISVKRTVNNIRDLNNNFYDRNPNSQDIIEYKGPQELTSTENTVAGRKPALNYQELGVEKVDDFTSREGVDYMRAYNGRVFNPNKLATSRSQYKNVNDLKSERGQEIVLTEAEKERIKRQKEFERQRELERKAQINRENKMWEAHHQKLNRLVIKN